MVWAPETVHCIIHFGTRFGGGGGGGGWRQMLEKEERG